MKLALAPTYALPRPAQRMVKLERDTWNELDRIALNSRNINGGDKACNTDKVITCLLRYAINAIGAASADPEERILIVETEIINKENTQ